MISCIVTTYKRNTEILSRAINSILNQTYKDIEVIVVNDAPEEKTLCNKIKSLIEKYPDNVKYVEHEKNKGACAARNTGIRLAKGEYIAFLDDDDEWMEDKLELQLAQLIKEDASLVYCDHLFIDAKGNEIYKKPFMDYVVGRNDFEKLLCFNFIGSTSFPLLKASALKEVGGFNENLKSSQDHEVWLKIARKNKISYVGKALVKYYYTEVAITRSPEKREQGYTYILNEFKKEYKNNKEVLHCRYILLSTVYFGMHCFKMGFKYLMKAFCLKPFSGKNFSILSRTIKKIFTKLFKK